MWLLAGLCVLIAAVVTWKLSDLDVLARALERLMPTVAGQVLGSAALPLVAVLVALAGGPGLARSRAYPEFWKGLALGPALTMLLVAAPPGRNDPGSVVRDAVPVFAACTWVGFAGLAAFWGGTVLRRDHRWAGDLHSGRPGLAAPPEPPLGARTVLVRAGVASAVALCVLVPLLALG